MKVLVLFKYQKIFSQIGVKTECRSNLARLALFYGNKTNHPFMVKLHINIREQFLYTCLQNFKPDVSASPTLSMAILLQVKQVDSTVEAGAQFQQVLILY